MGPDSQAAQQAAHATGAFLVRFGAAFVTLVKSTRHNSLLPMLALGMVVASSEAPAASSGAPLAVSVTVVRSCLVRATPIDGGSAQVWLTCAAGAGATVRSRSDSSGNPRTLQLRAPTTPYRGTSVVEGGMQVVTLNF